MEFSTSVTNDCLSMQRSLIQSLVSRKIYLPNYSHKIFPFCCLLSYSNSTSLAVGGLVEKKHLDVLSSVSFLHIAQEKREVKYKTAVFSNSPKYSVKFNSEFSNFLKSGCA